MTDIAAMPRAGVGLADGLRGRGGCTERRSNPPRVCGPWFIFHGGDLETLSASERGTLVAASRSFGDLPPGG
ncbi:MAG: hypothetical protein ACR2FH_07450 [Caulobacteraceae bacterium]